MRSSQEIISEIEELRGKIQLHLKDGDMKRYLYLRGRLKRALDSEYFVKEIIPVLMGREYILECKEKGEDSYYITMLNGDKYVYYPSKLKLTKFCGNGDRITIKLYIEHFLEYLDYLVKHADINNINVVSFYQKHKSEYSIDEILGWYGKRF
jgi:ribosomal protein L33